MIPQSGNRFADKIMLNKRISGASQMQRELHLA